MKKFLMILIVTFFVLALSGCNSEVMKISADANRQMEVVRKYTAIYNNSLNNVNCENVFNVAQNGLFGLKKAYDYPRSTDNFVVLDNSVMIDSDISNDQIAQQSIMENKISSSTKNEWLILIFFGIAGFSVIRGLYSENLVIQSICESGGAMIIMVLYLITIVMMRYCRQYEAVKIILSM